LHGGGAENGLLRDVISYTAKTQGAVNYSGIWHFVGANHEAIVSANANNAGERISLNLTVYLMMLGIPKCSSIESLAWFPRRHFFWSLNL
jgi:hypothetical protein